ncbi:hypothetical protein VN0816_05390 [Helicobacter pylori]
MGIFARSYSNKEADKDLNKALSFLVGLEMDVIYPLLLELYSDYSDGVLSKDDFRRSIALIESYICRRSVCGLGTNSLNKVFPSFTKHIQKDEYFKSLKAHFGYLTEKQRFPNNDEFKDCFITIDFYHILKKEYFFERLENFDRKDSPLRLNQDLRDLESFGEEQIKKRANDLADLALKIWTYPKLDAETLEKYKPKKDKKEKKVYDLNSYKFGSHSRELFDILSKEIKALDEKIVENFNQDYISYKFSKNFVDIVVQTKDLKLYLNMKFNELQDEKNLARDMTNKGHLGNGNIEVKLETKENIPYCLGLIKQALEKQMGGRNKQ